MSNEIKKLIDDLDAAHMQVRWLENPMNNLSAPDYFSARLSFGSAMYDVYPKIRAYIDELESIISARSK